MSPWEEASMRACSLSLLLCSCAGMTILPTCGQRSMAAGRRGWWPLGLNVVCLVREPLNHPGSRRARWPVGAIDRLQVIEAAGPVRKIQTLQAPGGEIVANDRFGHIAPANTRQQQAMLGAQISQTPRPRAYHAEILALGKLRAVGEHQLCMVSRRSGRIRRTQRQRVAWRCYWYQLHTADTDPLESRNVAVARLLNTDMGYAGMNELGHCAKSFDMQAQSDSRKCRAESLHRVDQSCCRQHHIDGKADFGFEAFEQALDLGSQIVDANPDGARFRQHGGAGRS